MSKQKVFNFTVASISQLSVPVKGRDYYKDSKENGLGIYVTAGGAKTFFVRKRVKGSNVRMIIGSAKEISVEQARKGAQKLKGQVALGEDPVAMKKKEAANRLTFGEHFQEYLERYSKRHKKSWIYDEREVKRFLSHWFNRRLSDITKADVQKLHLKMYDQNGLYQANRILERIRAMYNKAIEWGWEGANPATGIKKYKEKSRDRFILPNEMPHLIKSLNEEENDTARDYFWMLLLTGARRTNTLMMRWEEINWQHKIWRIPDSKNGEPVNVPLVARAIDILSQRQEKSNSDWVFPSDTDFKKHFINPKRAWKRVLQRATIYFWLSDERFMPLIDESLTQIPIGLPDQLFKMIMVKAKDRHISLPTALMDIHLHDIRRTFGSYQAITGASLQIIGKSLGHKSQHATQVYARLNLDPVRASIERATDVMFGLPQSS